MAIDWMQQRKSIGTTVPVMLGHKAPTETFPNRSTNACRRWSECRTRERAFQSSTTKRPGEAYLRSTRGNGIYGRCSKMAKEFPNDSAARDADFEKTVRAYWGTILSVE